MPLNIRTLHDCNLTVLDALPAAGASSNSAPLDTCCATPGRIPNFEALIECAASPALVDAKKITLTLQDSADGQTFAVVTDVPPKIATGASGAGGAAISSQFKLPITLRRYVRLNAAVDSAGGDNTALSASLSVIF